MTDALLAASAPDQAPNSAYDRAAVLDAAVDAALALAAARPWGEVSLRDIAEAAGVPFAELYSRAPGKPAVLDHLSRRLDRAALDTPAAEPDVHDRLFDAVMARIEAQEPHRAALISMARAEGVTAHGAARLALSARAFLESAGVDSSGLRGAARVAAMAGVWARVLQVWRDDEGALNRTMAELDARLKSLRRGLERVRAGF